jgi:hypothetical protein
MVARNPGIVSWTGQTHFLPLDGAHVSAPSHVWTLGSMRMSLAFPRPGHCSEIQVTAGILLKYPKGIFSSSIPVAPAALGSRTDNGTCCGNGGISPTTGIALIRFGRLLQVINTHRHEQDVERICWNWSFSRASPLPNAKPAFQGVMVESIDFLCVKRRRLLASSTVTAREVREEP